MVVGPYSTLPLADGTANLYLLRYDKRGALQSPHTFEALKREISTTGATDVFLFSHGWNNVFDQAVARYDSFIRGYMAQRAEFGLPTPPGYRPVLVGVIWPSTSFVMPWEQGPKIAAAPGQVSDDAEEMTRLLTEELAPADAALFAELVDGGQPLGVDQAREAATALTTALSFDGDDGSSGAPSVDDIMSGWMALNGDALEPVDPDEFGTVGKAVTDGVAVAGLTFDPRDLLRMGTVWTMKARAGAVGATGVSSLVQFVLNLEDTDAAPAPRLHLIGHSFGAKVVLSSLGIGDTPRRKAHSVLLLEPAINRWCFAPSVIGTGQPGTPGGYHIVFERVRKPIFATFSVHDQPLHEFFHLAIRKAGELEIAAVGDVERFGALGGYGPNGLDGSAVERPAIEAGSGPYVYPDSALVVAIDGGVDLVHGAAIKNHGDVSNPATWWALHQLTGSGAH